MSKLAGHIPTKLTVVAHESRDITFILPQADPEVGFLPSNYEKRLGTATKWAGKGAKIVEIENEAVSGFSIETLNGRYHTEVEYVLVRHPEGYVFEVPFQNLLDILKSAGCGVGGVISQPCKLFAMGGKWRIIPVGTDLEEEAITADKEARKFVAEKKKNASKKFVVGQVVKMRDADGYWVYMGKKIVNAHLEHHVEFFRKEGEQYRQRPEGGHYMTAGVIRSVADCKVTIEGSLVVSEGKQVSSDGSTHVFRETKNLEPLQQEWMVFVRLPEISKTDSITNTEFMKKSWGDEKPKKPEMLVYKGKSVQFQPTDEFDHATVQAVKGVKFYLDSVGGKGSWELLQSWDEVILGISGWGGGSNVWGSRSNYQQELSVGCDPVVGQVFEPEVAKDGRFYVECVHKWSGRHVDGGRSSSHDKTYFSVDV